MALPPSPTTESGGDKAEPGTEVSARGKNELREGMLRSSDRVSKVRIESRLTTDGGKSVPSSY